MNEGKKSASELFEAHSDSAMIFDLHEKAFSKMPFFVVIEIGVSSCHLCAPHEYLCRNHIIHNMSDFCKMFSIPFKRLRLETHSNQISVSRYI